MTKVALRQQLHHIIDVADDNNPEAIYMLLQQNTVLKNTVLTSLVNFTPGLINILKVRCRFILWKKRIIM